jgi:sRNA-binding carbon storage regulator CsrA
MPLSLGVSVGDRIEVGDSIVKVKAIKNHKLIIVSVNGGPDISVNDNNADAVEILPDVRLFTGLDRDGARSRLAFDAPRSIKITRIEPPQS